MKALHRVAAIVAVMTVASPAPANLVIQGRDAQILHCAAMQLSLSAFLYNAGFISRINRDQGMALGLVFSNHLPGTDKQRKLAIEGRIDKLVKTRTPKQLFEEWKRSRHWCVRNILKTKR